MSLQTIVVLAKSYKPGGYCLAGKLLELDGSEVGAIGSWVRPVPNDGKGNSSINKTDCKYPDGRCVRLLDFMQLEFNGEAGVAGQPENMILDNATPFTKLGSFKRNDIESLADSCSDLWLDLNSPTSKVSKNCSRSMSEGRSLCLIKPKKLVITLANNFNKYEGRHKKKTYASFDYNDVHYSEISITCPATLELVKNQYPGEDAAPNSTRLRNGDNYLLCMSLTLPMGCNHVRSKLVANILDYDGSLQRQYES